MLTQDTLANLSTVGQPVDGLTTENHNICKYQNNIIKDEHSRNRGSIHNDSAKKLAQVSQEISIEIPVSSGV